MVLKNTSNMHKVINEYTVIEGGEVGYVVAWLSLW